VTPTEFLDQLLPAARASQQKAGIPASFTLAQAALESAWGTRAVGCNLFGVKADKSWAGPVTLVPTHEVINGQRVALTDKFRGYASWDECLADHVRFFQQNRHYAACFHEVTGEGWARAVAAAGYATDPDYASKIISVIRAHNLGRFDAVQVTA
jgi:flagellar protein FlgJ